MSVPLPSPSLTSPPAKAIPPRSRPQPIASADQSQGLSVGQSPSSRPFASSPHSPGSPRHGSGSLRKTGSKAIGFGTSSGGGDAADNWRDRSVGGPKSAVRTVGGFEKKVAAAPLAAKASSPKEGRDAPADKGEKDKDKDAEGKASLSHVPCRFFKAGACTAGNACPFSHEEGGKKEVCQWFLKGNCKFGHKCALAHVRPGEHMSMDRKNKKAAQLEAKEREGGSTVKSESPRDARLSRGAEDHRHGSVDSGSAASPVPIRSALSSSLQSPPAHRIASSPLRDPIGPPSSGPTGGTSPGFARSPIPLSAFASSPSRPSPLSASFTNRTTVPGPFSLRSSTHSPLRPPTTAISSSFSHSNMRDLRSGVAAPLSASFADNGRKNIWARNETPLDQPELLSPRRGINAIPQRSHVDVFEDLDEEDHGEDLLPSSLSDLLTPRERARRLSRRDSNESFSASPSRNAFLWNSGERLAQSAGPTMGPGFLQGLWSAEGADARKAAPAEPSTDFTYGEGAAQALPRASLLSAQRSPTTPQDAQQRQQETLTTPPFVFRPAGDPHSPGTKALQQHAPGQSLPGGLANALSRLHLHGPKQSSGLSQASTDQASPTGGASGISGRDQERASAVAAADAAEKKRDEHEEEGLFAMDG